METRDGGERGTVTSPGQIWRNQDPSHDSLHHGLSGPLGPMTAAGDLGAAFSMPAVPNSEPGDLDTAFSLPDVPNSEPGDLTASTENQSESCDDDDDDFCESYSSRSQTARKLVHGAPRQEKTDAPKSCPENAPREEGTVCPPSLVEEETSCPDRMTEQEIDRSEQMTDKETDCFRKRPEKEMDCPEIKDEKESEAYCIPLTANIVPNDAKPKLAGSAEGSKADSSLEDHSINKSRHRPVLDNRLLEELEAVPLPQSMKDLFLNWTLGIEVPNTMLKLKELALWNSVKNIISCPTVSALPSVPDQKEVDIRVVLDPLLAARTEDKTEDCGTEGWAEEKKTGVEEILKCAGSRPMDKSVAVGMVRSLFQHNQLTNSTLTRIYSCCQEGQPDSLEHGSLLRSKDLKNILTSLTHNGKDDEWRMWQSLTGGGNTKDKDPLEKTFESRKENDALSLKADVGIADPWHLSELSVDSDRFPVENSFYFPTNASSSLAIPQTDISHVGGQGRFMKLLSMLQMVIRMVGFESLKKGYTVSSREDEQKCRNGQKEKETDEDMEKDVDMNESAAQKETTDDQLDEEEEIDEKVDSEEKELKSSVLVEEEIQEKSEYEESEKVRDHSTVPEPSFKEKFEHKESEKGRNNQSTIEAYPAESMESEKLKDVFLTAAPSPAESEESEKITTDQFLAGAPSTAESEESEKITTDQFLAGAPSTAESEESEKITTDQFLAGAPSTARKAVVPVNQEACFATDVDTDPSPPPSEHVTGSSRPVGSQKLVMNTRKRTGMKKMKTHGQQQFVDKKQKKRSALKKKKGPMCERGEKTTEAKENKQQIVIYTEKEGKRTRSSTFQPRTPAKAGRVHEECIRTRKRTQIRNFDVDRYRHLSTSKAQRQNKQGLNAPSHRPQEAPECHVGGVKSRKSHEVRKKTCPPKAGKHLSTLVGGVKPPRHQQKLSAFPQKDIRPGRDETFKAYDDLLVDRDWPEGDEAKVDGRRLVDRDWHEGDEAKVDGRRLVDRDWPEGDEAKVDGRRLVDRDWPEGDEAKVDGRRLVDRDWPGRDETEVDDRWHRKKDWMDVRGGGIRVRKAGDGPHGSSGNSAGNLSSSGGGDSSRGWGGARPRNSGGGGSGTGGDGDGGGGNDERPPPSKKVPDSLPLVSTDPSRQKVGSRRNFKRHRKKKHGAISNEQLCHCLGQAGKGLDVLRQSSEMAELDHCLRLCLHDTHTVTSPFLTPDDLACCTCAVLISLLSHFSGSAHGQSCPMCLQLFTLVTFHLLHCQAPNSYRGEEEEEEGVERESNICRRLQQTRLLSGDGIVTTAMPKIWTKVRKHLSAALGPALLLDIEMEGLDNEATAALDDHPPEESLLQAASGDHEGEASSAQQQQGSSSAMHPVAPDHQQTASVMPKPSVPGSKLYRRPSQKVVPQKTIPEEPTSPHHSPTPPTTTTSGEGSEQATGIAVYAQIQQQETTEDSEDIMKYIHLFNMHQQQQPPAPAPVLVQADQLRGVSIDDTMRTYGQGGRFVSMPEPERYHRGLQLLSVETRPVGTPGIGEVVYGTTQQLCLVARNWVQERDLCKASGVCQYQHREEGVILNPFRRQLKILHTRYQKHQQWERLVHLGNGVTGKCHLCIDRTSNFKFCCKKVHILHYEDQELDIWSELDHPNITRFYGAIRHGEKIYMFAQFIDGGSLAAMIKEQWLVGRRLSHWTSLNYIRQLLQVLKYLQTKGVLHEDIKADNLLLKESTTEIVLADFGAAQRIPHDHTPPNRHPTGSPAHWSPEKAASEGHGFSSDLWAAACVLIHMLSGSPPWVMRYPDAAILNYIIWSKPPPLDDLPADVKESVRDLLACCLVKDKAIRPSAGQILSHSAFRLLDDATSFFSIAQNGAAPAVSGATATPPLAVGLSGSQPPPPPVQVTPLQAAAAAPPQNAHAAAESVQSTFLSMQRAPPCVPVTCQCVGTTPPHAQTTQAGSLHPPAAHIGLSQSGAPAMRESAASPGRRPVLRVVETPRRSLATLRGGGDGGGGPQSLPIWPSPSQLPGRSGDPSSHHPPLGPRKSDPSPSALVVPTRTQEADGTGGRQRKMGLVGLDPSGSGLEAKDGDEAGRGNSSSGVQQSGLQSARSWQRQEMEEGGRGSSGGGWG